MSPRRSAVASATFWLTPKVMCLEQRSTVRTSSTKMGSRAAVRVEMGSLPAPFSLVAGRRLQGQGERVGGEGFGLDGGDRATSFEDGFLGNGESMGRRVGQGRSS